MLYMYLASNANNYNLALSPAAIQQATGMPRSTYRDQFCKLVSKGYLIQTGGNTFSFYEVPQTRVVQLDLNAVTATGRSFEDSTITAIPTTDTVNSGTGWNREINNREFLDNGGINIEEHNPYKVITPVRTVCIPSPSAMDRREPKEKKEPFQDFFF